MKLKTLALFALSGTALLLSALSPVYGIDNNLRLHGVLVEEPCVIKPGDETVKIDFGNIPDKTFYIGAGRTTSQNFAIHLSECDLSINSKVKVTFKGEENQAMAGQGFLALNANSQASGIAIGLENADGSLLKINQESSDIALTSGDSILRFKAFIQAEPTAIANRAIKRGTFNAIATFHLNYD
ncbi:fimbrial protein [Proteus myxofaciens]|uniref:Minor fimbrial subunit n=1 Tax=Proteus myxofaciens ATCC 19692 TaxID=1354337 RepID=A0A198FJD9_9GAMM|nr:fimbrial protein [Proteus myxofaciens]OAT24998.1 minor fimbrial subunit [Proteus myxofaciens ATCC 19692]